MERTYEQVKDMFDFNSERFMIFLNNMMGTGDKIRFSNITNWHDSHPFYRLNFYDGIQISQVPSVYYLFSKDWLSKFDNIVEIGSYNGGLSSYIFDNKKEGASFVSYDIDTTINSIINEKKRFDIDFRIGDCFEEKTYNEIKELIQQPGRTLLICDGGDKTKEFNEFSQYLKKDDIIVLHDYADNESEFFAIRDYWQWPYSYETCYDVIKDSVEKYNLSKFEYSKFNFCLWGSFIKN